MAACHNQPSNLSGIWWATWHTSDSRGVLMVCEWRRGGVRQFGLCVSGWLKLMMQSVAADDVQSDEMAEDMHAAWLVSERALTPQTSCRDYSHGVRHRLYRRMVMNVLHTRAPHTCPRSSVLCKSGWPIWLVNVDLLKQPQGERETGESFCDICDLFLQSWTLKMSVHR